jgi:hypothetical protein
MSNIREIGKDFVVLKGGKMFDRIKADMACNGCAFLDNEDINDDEAICSALGKNCITSIWKERTQKTVYISGPMSGYPDLNFPAFFAKEDELIEAGYKVINPARLNPPKPADVSEDEYWQQCMKRDVVELMRADLIVLLKGWQKSRGAVIEYDLATNLGIKELN